MFLFQSLNVSYMSRIWYAVSFPYYLSHWQQQGCVFYAAVHIFFSPFSNGFEERNLDNIIAKIVGFSLLVIQVNIILWKTLSNWRNFGDFVLTFDYFVWLTKATIIFIKFLLHSITFIMYVKSKFQDTTFISSFSVIKNCQNFLEKTIVC